MILVCDAWDRGGGFVLRIGEQFERAMREAVRRAE
jgi:hypothetical protein